ncbi:MarR family winged helix-turn-helix transcriptional regulator [Hyphomonas sp.]|jgi:DNA-binding MarR family transcriptional regulator|uniref:MarR family winged helix-turn-helix transcriptional regulator n=1 Tax=Hyphomonas sp. TaxID=87 RepID=UPI0039E6480E
MITPSQTPAFELPCSAGRLLRAARVLTRHYDDALRPVGITITQFGLLKVIQRLEPESISDIAQALDIDRTTLSRNLKPLEKAGLVFRGSEGESRRRRVLLTTLGVAKLKEAQPFWQMAQDRVEDVLGDAKLQDLYGALSMIRPEFIAHP